MKKRNVNCDLLRILALIFVVALHSLVYIKFYHVPNEGPTMILLNICRCLFMTCVPIFLVLSGYLESKKKLNKKYLYKIVRIITTYILCSITCFIIINFINGMPEQITIKNCIKGILNFSAAPYSWYVNMYFGLFLLIPFLNILWNNLNSKKHKKYLLLVLIIISILPNSINIFNFDSLNWWLNPSSSRAYQQIIPNYWVGSTYILLYYFLGCYLKEFPLNIGRKKNIIMLLLSLISFGLFNYYRNYNALFEWSHYTSHDSLEALILTILFVNLIMNVKINVHSQKLTNIISRISYLTFGAYLLSAIFDEWFYPYVIEHTQILLERIPYAILTVALIVTCSLILSYLIDVMIVATKKLITLLVKILEKSKI